MSEAIKEAKTKKNSDGSFLIIEYKKNKENPKALEEINKMSFTDINSGLMKAVQKEDQNEISFFIEKGATKINNAFKSACASSKIEIAEFLITKGAINIDGGFLKACTSGSEEMVLFLLKKSPRNVKKGISILFEKKKFHTILKIDKLDSNLVDPSIVQLCISQLQEIKSKKRKRNKKSKKKNKLLKKQEKQVDNNDQEQGKIQNNSPPIIEENK